MSIPERAAEWLIRLDTATAEERAEFLAWIKQSPQHIREVLIAQACQVQLQLLMRSGRRIDANEFIRSAENVREIVRLERHAEGDSQSASSEAARTPTPDPQKKRMRWTVAAAVALVAALAAWTSAFPPSSNRTVATGAGEWRTVMMEDGSIVRAGPRTKLHIQLTDERRLIRLAGGEALCDVAKDPNRPFLVETNLATVRAVGTAFGVWFDGSKQQRVDVKEGVVEVAKRAERGAGSPSGSTEQVTLNAGEEVIVRPEHPLVARPVDVDAALAWANRRLVFNHQTVEEAVQEFNRRNELQIKVLDPKLQRRNVRGVFKATDPESFAEHLETQGAVAVMDEKSGTLLITPSPSGQAAEAND